MKIDNSYKINPTYVIKDIKLSESANEENVSGKIIDINNKELVIKTLTGQVIKGQIIKGAMDFLNIGDVKDFQITHKDGQMILNLDMSGQTQTIEDNLKNYNLTPSKQNVEFVKALIENNLPATKENILKLNQATILLGENSIKEGMFLLKNNIRINETNVDILKDIVSGENKIPAQIDNIFENIETIKNPVIKHQVLSALDSDTFETAKNFLEISKSTPEILTSEKISQLILKEGVSSELLKNISNNENIESGILEVIKKFEDIEKNLIKEFEKPEVKFDNLPETESAKKTQKEKLAFNIKDTEPKDLDEFLETIKEKINVSKEIIAGKEENKPELTKALNKFNDTLDFFTATKNSVFVQIPVLLNENKLDSEIYVFKDKRIKKRKDESISALISLDTINLGRFETFIQKNNKSLMLQFSLENEEIETIVKNNLHQLQSKLKSLNYDINNISFKNIKEPFNILENEKDISKDKNIFKFTSFDAKA